MSQITTRALFYMVHPTRGRPESFIDMEFGNHVIEDQLGYQYSNYELEKIYSGRIVHIFNRVPTQVLQSLIMSYICFSVCKALQSLISGIFSSKMSYKVLFLLKSKFQTNKMLIPS